MKKYGLFIVTFVFLITILVISACGANKNVPQQENVIDRNNGAPALPDNYSQQQPDPGNLLTPIQQPPLVPGDTPEEQQEIILGSYESTLLDTDKNRVKNIRLATKEISGYTVQPGEVFSFNGTVGKRVAEKGYKKAKIIVRKKRKEGIGGGICQVSSTLYNAVEQAGLEIVEKHSHSKDVHYVPKGRDATVVYGSLDFKFKNTKSYPVKIAASVGDGKVYVSILKAD